MHRFTFGERLGMRFNRLPVAVYDAFPAVLFGRMLVLAVRLGVIETLDHTPATVQETASALQLHPRSLRLILDALTEAGYLKQAQENYHLTPQSKKWLVNSSPHYLGNFLRYIELLHSHWQRLEETIKQGKPPATYIETFGEQEWEIYTLGMMDLARLVLPHITKKLTIPTSARRLLDVGGSHGLYSIELCHRHPQLSSTIIDLPQVFSTTRAVIAGHHLEARISLLPSDITSKSFDHGLYDVVLAFNIIHGFDETVNRKLLKGLSQTLAENGVLYILDQFRGFQQRGAGTMLPLMVGLNLLNEIGGNAYDLREVQEWCTAAGLQRIELLTLKLPGVTLLRASRD